MTEELGAAQQDLRAARQEHSATQHLARCLEADVESLHAEMHSRDRAVDKPGMSREAALWEVVYAEVNVRKEKDTSAKACGFRAQGTDVDGYLEGDWLRLADGEGYMR